MPFTPLAGFVKEQEKDKEGEEKPAEKLTEEQQLKKSGLEPCSNIYNLWRCFAHGIFADHDLPRPDPKIGIRQLYCPKCGQILSFHGRGRYVDPW